MYNFKNFNDKISLKVIYTNKTVENIFNKRKGNFQTMSTIPAATTKEVLYLGINKIIPNPDQPRKYFDDESLQELSMSIKEYGVLQPITVRYLRGNYVLIAGERRLRASKIAGLKYVPTIIINLDDEKSAVLALIENLQRQDLNYIEEAFGYYKLLKEYNITQENLAQKIGKNQSTIANKLRLLKLSDNVKIFLLQNDLTERHGRAVLKIDNEEHQLIILNKVVKNDLNVKKTEDLVERFLEKNQNTEKKKNQYKIKRIIKDIRIFTNTINQAVDIMKESGVDTDYVINETEDGYKIVIDVNYKKDVKELSN